jgi:O-antigen/teichoic acid export membrane protein
MKAEPPLPPTGRTEAAENTLRGAWVRSGVWNLAGKLTALVAVLSATPFTVRLLGPDAYGAWSLLQYMVAYLVLADLGMSAASTKLAGDRHAVGDITGEVAVVCTSAAMTALTTLVAAMALFVAAPLLVIDLLHIPGFLQGAMVTAVRIAALAIVIRSVAGTVNTPQMVRLHWGWVTLAVSGTSVLIAIGPPIVLATLGHGLVGLSGVILAAAVFALLINTIGALRFQPALRHPRVDRHLCAPLLRFGGALAISGLANLPLTNAERFLLSHFHGTVPVAHYAVAAALASMLAVLPLTITEPLFPALVRLNADSSALEATRLHRQALQGLVLLMTPAAILFGLVVEPFLALWAGSEYARESTLPFLILLVGFWFNALAAVPFNRLLASGRTLSIAKLHAAELVPYLLLAAGLTFVAGAIGAAIAFTARVVADSVFFFIAASRGGHGSFQLPLPKKRRRWLAVTASLLLAAVIAATTVSALSLRLTAAAVLGAVYIVALWKWVLTSSERTVIRGLALEVAGRLARPRGGAPTI